MTSDETQIQIFANWPMSHAKRVTRDNRKNPEYRVVANKVETPSHGCNLASSLYSIVSLPR